MLNDYAREQDQYFLDGASFVFLPGIHQLDLQLRLENISNISLCVLEEDGSAQILLFFFFFFFLSMKYLCMYKCKDIQNSEIH